MDIINDSARKRTYEQYLEDMTQEYEEPVPLLKMKDEIGNMTPVFTIGSLSIITGQAKSRKSFLGTLLMSELLNIHRNDVKPFIILHIDTEQSRYYFRKSIERLYRLQEWQSGTNNPQYIPMGFKTCPKAERKIFLEDAIKAYHPDFVFLDGARDMVIDFNEPVECGDFAEMISYLCGKYDTHICSVIHENRGSDKVRGHLGAEMTNKCETIMEVKLADSSNISTVEAKECRAMKFAPFCFKITDGIPEMYDAKEVLEQIENGGKAAAFIKDYLKVKVTATGKEIGDAMLSSLIANTIGTAYTYIRNLEKTGAIVNTGTGKVKIWTLKENLQDMKENENDDRLPF